MQSHLDILTDNMRALRFIFTFSTAFVQHVLCNQNLQSCDGWNCVNEKLGLAHGQASAKQYRDLMKGVLPEGPWHGVVENAVDICPSSKAEGYTNSCPGQAMMHCLVDQFIANCPEESLQKNDACSRVVSSAGIKEMFSQRIYENFAQDRYQERRPVWFLLDYYRSKCCKIPQLVNSTILSECGFNNFLQYHADTLKQENLAASAQTIASMVPPPPTTSQNDTNPVGLESAVKPLVFPDPLECCNMDDFIKQTWRSECNFELQWDVLNRVSEVRKPSKPIAPVAPIRERVGTTLPSPCQPQTHSTTCIMDKMDVPSSNGSMDYDKMKDLLHQLTSSSDWSPMAEVYNSAFTNTPVYKDLCNSPRKLLNVLDAMLMTCPGSRRTDSPACGIIFTELSYVVPFNRNEITREEFDNVLDYFHLVFFPTPARTQKHQ